MGRHQFIPYLRSSLPRSAPFRLQAARTLDDIFVVIPQDLIEAPSDRQATVHRRMLAALAQQVILGGLTCDHGAPPVGPDAAPDFASIRSISYSLAGKRNSSLSYFEVPGGVCQPALSDPASHQLLPRLVAGIPHLSGTCRKGAIRH